MNSPPALLVAKDLCKSYSAPVLQNFSTSLRRGEVHALMGANGAGKSTFAKILCGLTAPDSGTMQIDGRSYRPRSRKQAQAFGVEIVHQELNILSTLSIAENLFLGALPRRYGMLDRRCLHSKAEAALELVGLQDLPPNLPANRLGVGHQQLLEIASALARSCRILILDEPTAALTQPETETLFSNIRRLQSQGVGVWYISHRLDEIQEICDRVTVLRDGRNVNTHLASEITSREIIREMSGHDVVVREPGESAARDTTGLVVRGLDQGDRVRDVSLEVKNGEIVGIAGLVGAGRTETLRAIYGIDPAQRGEVVVGNSPRRLFRHPAQAVAAGIGLVPEDRKQQGLLLTQSVSANTCLASLSNYSRARGLPSALAIGAVQRLCERLGLTYRDLNQPVWQLSGGNQQKVILARWLQRDCQVLLCDEPTRGVDAAAKDRIHHLLRELAKAGKAILIVSSELPELMSLCDRILVMAEGRITAEFSAGDWSSERINSAAFNHPK